MGIDFRAGARYEEYTASEEHGGKTYRLRDTLPTELMLRVYDLLALDARVTLAGEGLSLGALTEPTEESVTGAETIIGEVMALAIEKRDLVGEIALDLFRQTLPEMTAETLDAAFTRDEQRAIVMDFFFRRLSSSSAPTSGTSEALAEENPAPTTGTTRQRAAQPATARTPRAIRAVPNRATRRTRAG